MNRLPLVISIVIWMLVVFYIYQIYLNDCPTRWHC